MKILLNLILSVLLLGGGVGFYFAIGKKEERKKPPVKKEVGIKVDLLSPQRVTEPVVIILWGEVKYSQLVEVKSEVEGKVLKASKKLRPGYSIKEGERLLDIDSERLVRKKVEIKANILKAEADQNQLTVEREAINAEMKLAAANVALAEADLKRHEELAAKNSVSPLTLSNFKQALIRQKTIWQKLKNQLQMIPQKKEALKATVASLRASVSLLDRDIEDAIIEAPFSGVILNPVISSGDYVKKGETVCRIYNPEKIEIWLPIGFAEKSKLGRVLKVSIAGKELKSNLRFLGAADKALQADTLIIDAESKGLKAGELVKCQVFGRTLDGLFVIPESALRADGKSVFKVVDGKLKIQPIDISISNNAKIYISSGLGSGDLVVTDRLVDVAEGTPVNQKSVEGVFQTEKKGLSEKP